MKIFGENATKAAEKTIDGTRFTLYMVNSSNKGVLRGYDIEAREVIQIAKYPTFERAEAEYKKCLRMAK